MIFAQVSKHLSYTFQVQECNPTSYYLWKDHSTTFPKYQHKYSSSTSKIKPSVLILLELSSKIISTNGWYILVNSQSYVLFPIPQRSDSTCSRPWYLIDGIASESHNRNVGLVDLNLSFLEKEYFCFELELLREWWEVSSSAIVDYLQ